MISRTFSGMSISSTVRSVRNWPSASNTFPSSTRCRDSSLNEEWVTPTFIKEEAGQTFRDLAPAQFNQHLRDGVPRHAMHRELDEEIRKWKKRTPITRFTIPFAALEFTATTRELTKAQFVRNKLKI